MNVFARLFDDSGAITDIDLGSLYLKDDASGLINELIVEPYDSKSLDCYEKYFDSFDEIAEVPKHVVLEKHRACTQAFFGDFTEIDVEDAEDDSRDYLTALKKYEAV